MRVEICSRLLSTAAILLSYLPWCPAQALVAGLVELISVPQSSNDLLPSVLAGNNTKQQVLKAKEAKKAAAAAPAGASKKDKFVGNAATAKVSHDTYIDMWYRNGAASRAGQIFQTAHAWAGVDSVFRRSNDHYWCAAAGRGRFEYES